MEIVSVNIGDKQDVEWKGKIVSTGIFKSKTDYITLGFEDVENDKVIDRKYHGGIDKACYLYSADHYEFWQQLYPKIDLQPGSFGENITIKGLNESNIYIGDIYRIGGATIQITQPRQPCFKLGLKFKTQVVLKQFLKVDFPGVYIKVLECSKIEAGESMELIERQHNSMSVKDVYRLLYDKEVSQDDLNYAIGINTLAYDCKESLIKRIN
jgi:MOSC domain-containing protein YiiM